MKTLFILGAGASVEAGLPTSRGLIEAVLDMANGLQNEWAPAGRAILWAHKQMLRRVESKNQANVELLFRILETASGQPRLPESAVFRRLHRQASKANREFLRADPPTLGFPYDSEVDVFSLAQRRLVDVIASRLIIQKSEEAMYVANLLKYCRDKNGFIVTLNYDNVIESASLLSGIQVDDGLSRWTELRKLWFDGGAVPLIKLHGSLNWFELDERLDGGTKRWPTIKREEEFDPSSRRNRVIVFGSQNKLSFRPPFPDLYTEFRSRIMQMESASVVGYSGSDPHVNQVLLDWGLSGNDRKYEEATCGQNVYSLVFGACGTLAIRQAGLKKSEWRGAQESHTGNYYKHLEEALKD